MIRRSRLNKWILTLAGIVVIIIGLLPFLSRVSDLKHHHLEVVGQESFAWDTPFNGLNFRILQWRLATEILEENNAWMRGVGIGSLQEYHDNKYIDSGIYVGEAGTDDTGYLGYNFHNQYLQTIVGTGLPGLLLLLIIIIFRFIKRSSNFLFPFSVYLISIIFFFTESVLERHAGIVFFCLIYFFLQYSKKNNSRILEPHNTNTKP